MDRSLLEQKAIRFKKYNGISKITRIASYVPATWAHPHV
jgi:hypothetical protein